MLFARDLPDAEWVPPKFLPLDGEGILFLNEPTAACGWSIGATIQELLSELK